MDQLATELVSTSSETERAQDPLWYKDAVVYQLHIKAFFDSNDDGIGDFHGLTEKLDYIKDLGVNTIWLLPFYPSPLRDDGYDVADYRNVNPLYGSRSDFHHFVREAHRRARASATITCGAMTRTSTPAPGSSSAIPRSRTGRGTTSRRRITGTG